MRRNDMDKIEKIRAEIERLTKVNKTKNGYPAGALCAVRIEAYEKLLSLLDTLSEEPVPDDLVEEVKRYYSDNFVYITSDQPTLSILTNIARHFAEWGADHLRESTKMEDKDLDEKMLRAIISDGSRGVELDSKQIAFLKSLRPQYHGDVTMTEAYKMGLEAGKASYWKPGEAQKERPHFVMQVLSDGHMKKAIEIYPDECDCKAGDVVKAIIRKKD